jgi:hypothetical protein
MALGPERSPLGHTDQGAGRTGTLAPGPILTLGLSIVLDFGLWAPVERDLLRTTARGLGVSVEPALLHSTDRGILAAHRRWEQATVGHGEPITRARLNNWAARFEAPGDAELSLFDQMLESELTHDRGSSVSPRPAGAVLNDDQPGGP